MLRAHSLIGGPVVRRRKRVNAMDDIRYIAHQSAGLGYLLAIAADGKDTFHGYAEEHGMWTGVQDCLLSLVSPGDTVLDIGANIGTVAIPLAAKGAHVFAYEALSENARFLAAAVAANGFGDRVTIRNLAVWDKAERLSFTGGSAWACVVAGGEATCEAVTIDADLPAGTTVKAIKIDVEGSELHALRGMRRLLASQHPHIVFESNSLALSRLGSSAAMIFRFLEELGYRRYRIYESKRLLRAGSLPQELAVADFLATPLGSFGLRWRSGKRVGTLSERHLVRRILGFGDHSREDHLHILAIAESLPAGVTGDRRVAARIAAWRERYGDHPMLDALRRGMFDDPAASTGAASRLPPSE